MIITPDEVDHMFQTGQAKQGEVLNPTLVIWKKSGDSTQSAQNFDNTVNDVGCSNFTF